MAFFKKCGVEVTFVPFDSGAEIKAAILGGHITGAVEELAETLPLIEAGKLRSPVRDHGKTAPGPSECAVHHGVGHRLHPRPDAGLGGEEGAPRRTGRNIFIEVIKKSLDAPIYKKFVKDNHLYARPGYLGPEETRKYWEEEVKFFTDGPQGSGLREVDRVSTSAANPYPDCGGRSSLRTAQVNGRGIMKKGEIVFCVVCVAFFWFMFSETFELLRSGALRGGGQRVLAFAGAARCAWSSACLC